MTIRQKLSSILFIALLGVHSASAQSIISYQHLEQVRQNLDNPYYARAYEELIKRADKALDQKPLSVTDKKEAPVSGDKHDYMSLARYYWPDPSKPDGLPYINRDGLSNPELEQFDRNRLGKLAGTVSTLALANYFSGDKRYAAKANELIRVWFFDKATRMNPNLRYAQVIKGTNGNRGRCYGVLDSYSFVEMLDAVQLMERTGAFSKADSKRLKQWMSQLLKWITTDPQGIEESERPNNHAVAYDAQVIALALYTGQKDLARKVIDAFPQRRLFTQIEADGSMPQELRRTLAFGYSVYNITHMIDVMLMAKNAGMMSWSQDAQQQFYKAVDFLLPYMGKDVASWPYKQISQWDDKQQVMAKELYRIAKYLAPNTLTLPNRGQGGLKYLTAYRKVRKETFTDIFNLLFVQPDATDAAMAFVAAQSRVAVKDAVKAKNEKQNLAEHRVSPRTISADGSLRLVGPKDWCSGFFPGVLWMIYEYTNDDYWRQQAVSFTWPIEEVKFHGGSHDLGFMMNDSFGKALKLTGERSYRDVLVQTAKTLITRFNPNVGCIRSWDHHADKWAYPVIVDNMMNLEMLFDVTRLTGDSVYWKVAVSHANTTMKNHFRPDASSYHVVSYNPETGVAEKHNTHQGYSDDSFWSRGQGWGLYGYTMCYRYTHDARYLDMARRIATFWLSLDNMPDDLVPYWDMKDPGISKPGEFVPRDASAAALIASAFYELALYVDAGDAQLYRNTANRIMDSLDAHYQSKLGENHGFLLLHSTGHKPANSEIDVPLTYADYYYVEALLRRQRIGGE